MATQFKFGVPHIFIQQSNQSNQIKNSKQPKMSNLPPSTCLTEDTGLFQQMVSTIQKYWDEHEKERKSGTFAWPPPKFFYKKHKEGFQNKYGNQPKKWQPATRNYVARIKNSVQ